MPRPLALGLAAIAMLSSAPAFAQPITELPSRRAGQWELRIQMDEPPGMPAQVIQACLDADTDRQMMQMATNMNRDMCARFDMRREGASILMDTDCRMGAMRSVVRTVITGDFQASYEMRLEGTMEGAPGGAGQQRMRMVQTGRHLGATCQAGMQPGDMMMPGGMRMNIRDLQGAMQRRPGG